MDKMTFASYKFKPSDVIEGLNRYFTDAKANRYLRVPLEIRNGEVKPGNYYVIRNIVFDVNIPKFRGYGDYYIICDPEEVVGVAINWLREEHDIFYTPGMEVPKEDCDIFCEENLDVVPVARVQEALGITEDSDIFQCIKYRNSQLETLRTELAESRRMHHNAIEERNQFGRRLADIRKAAGMADVDPTDLVEYIKTLREAKEALANHLVVEGRLRTDNSDLAIDVANLKEQLCVLRYDILKVYREIFDCSNGDPEGSDKENLEDILTEYKRVLKLKDVAEEKAIKYKELARKLRCELGVLYPVVYGCKEEMENDILERIGELKEGNWPCVNGNTFAEFMRKQFPKECEKWNVVPLAEGSVHDWVQYIFGILDEWRKRATKAEEELDRAWSHCGKLKGMLNTWYGTSCGDNVLPCYRDTCNNPKAIREREAAKDALAELRAKIDEVCNEIFDCSNGDPEGSDKEALEDILEEYRRVVRNFETLKRQLDDEKKLVSKVRAERDSNKARRLVFLDKLANILDVSYSSGFIPAKEQDILRAVETLSENYEATTRVLEEKRKEYDSLEALKSAYNSLRDDYDEVCEWYTKLKKDHDNIGEAYSSVLKWNNSYADVRRLLGISADADAGEMVGALNKLVCDYEQLKEAYEKAKCNTNYFVEFEKNCRERQAFIVKLCEALDIDTEDIGSFFDDEETAILKAIEEHHEATASIDQLRQNWYNRYKSEHERANGEHKRAEKLCSDITALKKQVEFLEESSNTRWNEVVALETFRNECRKLKDEKSKVIEALGQDIWDDCVK